MGNVYAYQNPIIQEMCIKSANNKRIYLNGYVDKDMAIQVSYFVNKIIEIDKKIENPKKEVIFIINSFGGSIIWGNSILTSIQKLKREGYRTIGIVESCAFSMAYDILINLDYRVGGKYSQYLLHQTSMGQEGELKEFEREIDFQKRVWEQSVDYYVKNTKLTKERVNEIYEKKENYFFLANEELLDLSSDERYVELEIQKELGRMNKEIIYDDESLAELINSKKFQNGCDDASYFCGFYTSLINAGLSNQQAFELTMNNQTTTHNRLLQEMINENQLDVAKVQQMQQIQGSQI